MIHETMFKTLINYASFTLQMNLKTQLSHFKNLVSSMVKKLGDTGTKDVLMSSVFLLSLGGNDYFSFSTNNPNATAIQRREYMHMVLGNLTSGLEVQHFRNLQNHIRVLTSYNYLC